MDIVKQRVGMKTQWCSQCHRTVVISGMMASNGDPLVCERCSSAGLPGMRGHDLPAFAIEWAEATGTQLDESVCAHEWRAWEIEEECAERSKQPEIAALAQQRSAWMLDAYKAFMAVRDEL